MGGLLPYPSPGTIIEYIEDGQVQTGFVLEETGGKLRLLLSNRRETRLGANRCLPWIGPAYSPALSKDQAGKILDEHKLARQSKSDQVNCEELWQLACGEMNQAPASWFAELFENEPAIDVIAAYGRTLLHAKLYFRFLNPDFLIFDEETVKKRIAEKEARDIKEKLAGEGSEFLRLLWEIATKRKNLPENKQLEEFLPEPELAEKLEKILFERMINPESNRDEELWVRLTHALPDNPFLPVQLLEAWKKIPPHYNFWLARADYNDKDTWWQRENEEVKLLANSALRNPAQDICPLPFISIDGESTTDIDDAFYLEKTDDGWKLVMAFANPALYWPFESNLDKKTAHRATSVYLPEGSLHMLPAVLGENTFSLLENQERPALCVKLDINEQGQILKTSPFIGRVKLKANLRYAAVQQLLDNPASMDHPYQEFSQMLQEAKNLSLLLEKRRIEQGAIIMARSEPEIELHGEGEDVTVFLLPDQSLPDSKRIISEMMILTSSILADWALKNNIPLIHRTQKISVPREYSGVWSRAEDLARIAKVLMPSILEVEPGFHAALGMPHYAPITSPLRRYADLINEAQINTFLLTGKPRLEKDELANLLSQFSLDLENSTHIQKYRPRYWKLLYFKQQGEKKWWPAVITDENEFFYMLTLPEQGFFIKAKRQLFEEKAMPGMNVNVRLSKVNPLFNEIQVVEVMMDEQPIEN